MLKLTIRTTPLLVLLLLPGVLPASAQGISAYFGAGSATDGATTNAGCPSKQIVDPFNPSGPPASCVPAPTIGGAFGVFGADFMILPHLGVNGEYSFRFAQAPYLVDTTVPVTLNVRPAFYDFNAVYQPTAGDSRIVPVLEGGIGGARLSIYESSCITSICSSYNAGISANHFAVHGAVGVKIYVSGDIFIKPQVDVRYVRNLNQQYNSNFMPEYTVSVGYTFGRH